MTDDGGLSHRIVSPKAHLAKIYEVTLAQDLRGHEVSVFAAGTLRLESDPTPLAPAPMQIIAPRQARVTLTEGRYHQVRRMFAAVGNHVEALHRSQIGGLRLEELPVGEWRTIGASDLDRLFGR
jgi:16S rRNA pseudouridine516 synthase